MPGWTLLDTHPTRGRSFQRPVGTNELAFLWDGLFSGTADNIHHYELRLVNASRDAQLFSEANIVRAWLSTKRRYPLVGATVEGINASLRLKEVTESTAAGGEGDDGDNNAGFVSQPYFVVRERDLSVLRPCEVMFGEVTSAAEVQRRVTAIFDGPPPLSSDLLVQVRILRETDSKKTDVFHLMVLFAHCITDRVSSDIYIRCFLDTLARAGSSGSEPVQVPLEDRLAMEIPIAELEPIHLRLLSPAMRRWRRATGAVIAQLRGKRSLDGHTLPCRVPRSTLHVAARSGYVSTSFTHAQSTSALFNCRLHNITLGNAYLVLAQVAMARVLYRRYLRGEISDEEWTYRKRHPYTTSGPVNLRPYLDKTWFDKGGGGEFMLSIHFLYCHLPFMTLGTTAEQHLRCKDDRERALSDGAPPFPDLLTFDRFLYRARMVKERVRAFFSHPLFFEIIHAENASYAAHTRRHTLQWMKRIETGGDSDLNGSENEVTSVLPMTSHLGTTFGNLDLSCPSEYPIPPTHPLSPYSSVPHPAKAGYVTPPPPSPSPLVSKADTSTKITVESMRSILHVHSSELYLCTYTFHGQLNMLVYYDANVFEDGVVREWLDEIKGAVLWYLCRTHPESRHVRRDGSDGRATGVDGAAEAKL